MTIPRSGIFVTILILSFFGVLVSGASLYDHYRISESSFCDFGGNFNCDIVNRSVYSEISGVPVALIGVLGYAALLRMALFGRKKSATPILLVIASLAGLGFALYLTYVEKFLLAVWCILCLTSLGLISMISVLSLIAVGARRPS